MKIIPLITLLALTGCASVHSTALLHHEPREKNCTLDIYVDGEVPFGKKYRTVGLLEMNGDFNSIEPYLKTMKARSCELGADAIVLPRGGLDSYAAGYSSGMILHASKGQALAIRFEERP